MTVFVAFLRAVNVSPRWVKMGRLRNLLSDNGFSAVETHIQSGNVRFSTAMRSPARVCATLESLLETEFGFAVPVLLRTPADLSAIVAAYDALPDPIPDVQRRYITLCRDPIPEEAAATINAWDVEGERLRVVDREILWWLAKSTVDAKISNARLAKLTGDATTRDLKVMRALATKWGKPA